MNLLTRRAMAMPHRDLVLCERRTALAPATMYRFDLQSLALHEHGRHRRGRDRLTSSFTGSTCSAVKITHVYAGDFKEGQSVVVGLSASIDKVTKDGASTTQGDSAPVIT